MGRSFATALSLTLLSSCFGGRVGFREGIVDEQLSSFYGGLWGAFAWPVGDHRTVIGIEGSTMVGGAQFQTVQPQVWLPITEHADDFALIGVVGLGLDFEDGVGVHLSGCAQALFFIYANSAACLRGSTQGWVGADASLGVGLGVLLDLVR